MNFKMILKTLGKLLIVEAILMCLPLLVSLIYKESLYLSFIIPIILLLVIGVFLTKLKPKNSNIYTKEGLAIVGLSWIVMSLFGCLPFIISRYIPTFIDAFFETVSGFTTTGATILTNLDSWYQGGKSLLFWRIFTHWIGGMGILVFVIAVLPKSEGQTFYILKAESPGPQVGKLVSKVRITARILYLIYLGLTIIQAVLLYLDPSMSLYDSIVHALSTAGTGGFGVRGDSVASYSNYVQIVLAIFMLIFGINFNLFYLLLIGNFKQVFKNEELRWYLCIILISVGLVTYDIYTDVNLLYNSLNFGVALKDSFFQVTSIISTTGFATVDFTKWSTFSQTILFILLFTGGCAGSTSGGLKISRIAILFKAIKREIKKLTHPNSYTNVKFEGSSLDGGIVKAVTSYFVLIIFISAVCILVISLNGFDFTTNVTAVVTCINNVGPGLGNLIGPVGSFADFNVLSKITLILAMLIGRLEIYPILILFLPKLWSKHR